MVALVAPPVRLRPDTLRRWRGWAARRLTPIVHDLSTTAQWPETTVAAALLLYDVCCALGLDEEEALAVLGAPAIDFVVELGTSSVERTGR
jgi:hypothetical protein